MIILKLLADHGTDLMIIVYLHDEFIPFVAKGNKTFFFLDTFN